MSLLDSFWSDVISKLGEIPSGRFENSDGAFSYSTYMGFCGCVEREKYVEIYISPLWNGRNVEFCKSVVGRGNAIFKSRGLFGRILLYKKHIPSRSDIIRVVGRDAATGKEENYTINISKVGYKLIRRHPKGTPHVILYCHRQEALKLANYAIDEEKNTTLLGKVIKTTGGNQYSVGGVILGHCVGEMVLMNGVGNCAIDIYKVQKGRVYSSSNEEILSLDGLRDELLCEMALAGMKVCERCEINDVQYLGEWVGGICNDCNV